MLIKTIAEHSVDINLLKGGYCIDAGCRGFQFSEGMRDLGCKVIAIDIENMIAPPDIDFYKYALWYKEGQLLHHTNPNDVQAKHISDTGTSISSHTLDWFYKHCCYNKKVDVLKMDIEGSEYYILSDENFKPIPKQLSIEFHLHCHKELHDRYYQKCMDNILQHYNIVQHELTEAHGAGFNYWDSCFVRKDLCK